MSAKSGPVGVGFIGTGMISDQYLKNLVRMPDIKVVALGDLNEQSARAKADAYGVPEAGSSQSVLDNADVEIVINLTIPAAHVPVSLQAIAAGKHVWLEKPIGIDREEAGELLAAADKAGLLVGVAPDTVLNPGIQTALRTFRSGVVGKAYSARTMMRWTGPDIFHPNPDFFFAKGGGPLLDMGPYYLTTLVDFFGPVKRVVAIGSRAKETRTVKEGPRAGESFPVVVHTHVDALISFDGGVAAQCTFSNDSPVRETGIIELFGETGMLVAPDPNMADGSTRIARHPTSMATMTEPSWETVEPDGPVVGRGMGVLDMARVIRGGGQHIATGELALHVLDVLLSIEESADSGQVVEIASTVGEIPLVDTDRDPFAATL
jgi:predicted dehydrogenase